MNLITFLGGDDRSGLLGCLVISGRWRWMDILPPLTQETVREGDNYYVIASS